jgi:hypothetical protein
MSLKTPLELLLENQSPGIRRLFQPSPVRFKSPQAAIEPRQQLERWSQSQRHLPIGADQLYGPGKTEDFFVRRYFLPDGRMVVITQQGGVERWWVQAPGQQQQEPLCYYGYINDSGYETEEAPRQEYVFGGITFYLYPKNRLYFGKTCTAEIFSQKVIAYYQHSDDFYQWWIDHSDEAAADYFLATRGFYSSTEQITTSGEEVPFFDFRNAAGASLYALRYAAHVPHPNGGVMGGFVSSNPLAIGKQLVVGAFASLWLPDDRIEELISYPTVRDDLIHVTANQEYTAAGGRFRMIDAYEAQQSEQLKGYILDFLEDEDWVEVGVSNSCYSGFNNFSFLTAKISRTSNEAELWRWTIRAVEPPSVGDDDWLSFFDINGDGVIAWYGTNKDETPYGMPVAQYVTTLDGAVFDASIHQPHITTAGALPTVFAYPPINWGP